MTCVSASRTLVSFTRQVLRSSGSPVKMSRRSFVSLRHPSQGCRQSVAVVHSKVCPSRCSEMLSLKRSSGKAINKVDMTPFCMLLISDSRRRGFTISKVRYNRINFYV